jgi:hypothetical protein
MFRRRWLLVALIALMPLVSCSDGGECDTCDSDDDCSNGLMCVTFDNGSRRCGSGQGVTQCRTFGNGGSRRTGR